MKIKSKNSEKNNKDCGVEMVKITKSQDKKTKLAGIREKTPFSAFSLYTVFLKLNPKKRGLWGVIRGENFHSVTTL